MEICEKTWVFFIVIVMHGHGKERYGVVWGFMEWCGVGWGGMRKKCSRAPHLAVQRAVLERLHCIAHLLLLARLHGLCDSDVLITPRLVVSACALGSWGGEEAGGVRC